MQRDPLFAQEMIDAIDRIAELTQGQTAASIEADPDRHDSLLWNFTVLGEAANRISDEMKADNPQIPWQDPIRVRNRIVHGYWSADVEILLAAATEDLPTFRAALDLLNLRSNEKPEG